MKDTRENEKMKSVKMIEWEVILEIKFVGTNNK